ncbi:hypothetical protein ACFY5D_02235 [Paeniglutamicibacter sp. NPDC012692]|uniref:hypothetical protein n=1 Tax=Paeniglutamicibacter sp. NPDC012692 TaxID=3364388 RepID=UPI00368D0AA0
MKEESPARFGLSLPTPDWLLIDGALDNLDAVSLGDPSLVQWSGAIREAVLRDMPGRTADLEGSESRPAVGTPPEIRLPRETWAFIIDALGDVEADRMLADDSSLPPETRELHARIAARSEAIAAEIRKRLGP